MDWRKAGVWVELPSRVGDPTEFGRKIYKSGFRWVTIKLHDGMALNEPVVEAIRDGWIKKLNREGISVGAWGVLRDNPVGEVVLINRFVSTFGFAHYIADAEGFHKGDWVDPDTGKPGDQFRSDKF